MVKNLKDKTQKADLDLQLDYYEPSESDDEDYDDNEKVMLQQAAKRRARMNDDDEESEEEVFGIHDSEDNEEDENEDLEPIGDELDSDIEGKNDDDGLPDSKAWGSQKRSYYNTDYVDQDYGGFSKAEEEEAALLEEEEARAIQTRLIAELEDADLDLGIAPPESSEKKAKSTVSEDDVSGLIKADISKLSKREKLALLEKESPEFMGLVSDFKERMTYARDNLEPIIKLVKSGEIPPCPAVEFVSTKYHIILNYCTNIAFYLLLKCKRVRVSNHPVIKRLVQFRKLLEQMDPIDEEVIQPQVKEILELKEKGKSLKVVEPPAPTPLVIEGNRAQRRKMLQKLREEEDEIKNKKPKVESFEEMQLEDEIDENEDYEEDDEDKIEKRGITYEIAKNKGLTPKRKKENRNPRVKHRNKYRKATIRRKGQVRGVYKETKRYDGEPFGIKASVTKSIRLK